MKKRLNLLMIPLVLGSVLMTSCNGGNNGNETNKTSLADVLAVLDEASSYEVLSTSNVEAELNDGTVLDGWNQIITFTDFALERNWTTSSGEILSNGGVCNYQDGETVGVMKYSYDENGDVVAGKIVDLGKTLINSTRVELPMFKNITLPSSMEDGLEFEFDTDMKTDLALLDQFLAMANWTSKGLGGNIEKATASYSESDKSVTVDVTLVSDEKIQVVVKDINSENLTLSDVEDFLLDGGQPLEVDSELLKIQELCKMSNIFEFIYSDSSASESRTDTVYCNYDFSTPYVYLDYINNDVQVDEDSSYQIVDMILVPLIGVSGLPNNIYSLPVDAEGNILVEKEDGSGYEVATLTLDVVKGYGMFNDVIAQDEALDYLKTSLIYFSMRAPLDVYNFVDLLFTFNDVTSQLGSRLEMDKVYFNYDSEVMEYFTDIVYAATNRPLYVVDQAILGLNISENDADSEIYLLQYFGNLGGIDCTYKSFGDVSAVTVKLAEDLIGEILAL